MTVVELPHRETVERAMAQPARRSRFVWPAGTWSFALRTWLALALALYLAFVFQLEGASSAGVCVMLLAQPIQGMVLSKALYRTIGTLVGVVAAVTITSLFPQDRTMILAAFTIWMGLCTAVATLLRDFRAYGTVLAGYSVAIISIANIDAPEVTFTAAIDRVAAILIGVAAIGFVNALFVGATASHSLYSKLRAVTVDVIGMAYDALDRREPPDPVACMTMSTRLIPLRSQISFATPELADGRQRARGARSTLLGLFEMLSSIQAVGAGLRALDALSPAVTEAVVLVRRGLRSQHPDHVKADLDALAHRHLTSGSLSLEEAFTFNRMSFLLDTLTDVRDGLRSVRTGRAPRRDVNVPVHQDYFSVLLNFLRVVVSVGIICALGVWSGQAGMAEAILFAAVYVGLGSINPNPSAMGFVAVVGLPLVVLIGALYQFLILPVIDGFPLFALSLAPVVLITCYLLNAGQQGFGAIVGTMVVVLVSPANPQVLDPVSFLSNGVMFVVSGLLIFLSFRIVLPVLPAQRRLRLALAVGKSLRRALRDKDKRSQPRASLQYDRLSQFKQWLDAGPVSLAHRKTLMRLNDIGNLAFAVRRAWRALDACQGVVPPELDRHARNILPTLSPEATEAVARDYFAAVTGENEATDLALVHAAAALHGTAFVTLKEERLLRRTELLRRAQ